MRILLGILAVLLGVGSSQAKVSVRATVVISGFVTNTELTALWWVNDFTAGPSGTAESVQITGNGTYEHVWTNAFNYAYRNLAGVRIAARVCPGVEWRVGPGPFGFVMWADNSEAVIGPIHINIDPALCGGSATNAPMTNTWTTCVTNNTWESRQAVWYQDFVVKKAVFLGPGETSCYTFVYDPQLNEALSYGMNDGYPVPIVDPVDGSITGYTNQVNYSTLGDWNTTNIAAQNNPDLGTNSAGVNNGIPGNTMTNGAINFTNMSTAAARDSTLQAGFNALLAQAKADQVTRAAMMNKLSEIAAAGGGGGGGSNYIGGETGVVDAIERLRADQTNLWGNVTNMAALGTNVVESAPGHGVTNTLELRSALGALSNAFGNIGVGETAPVELGGAMTVTLPYGQGKSMTMNFNPLANDGLAKIFAMVRKLIEWGLYLAYAFAVFKTIQLLVGQAGATTQGRWMKFQIFGNNVDLIVMPVFLIGILACLAIVIAFVTLAIGVILTGQGGEVMFGNPLAGHGSELSTGISLARHAFPFVTFFSLCIAWGVWRLACIGVMSLYVVTMKALMTN